MAASSIVLSFGALLLVHRALCRADQHHSATLLPALINLSGMQEKNWILSRHKGLDFFTFPAASLPALALSLCCEHSHV